MRYLIRASFEDTARGPLHHENKNARCTILLLLFFFLFRFGRIRAEAFADHGSAIKALVEA